MESNNNAASYLERTHNGTSFSGSDVDIFGALAIATALRHYAKCGMQVSSAATPKVMFYNATRFTGKTYKRGQYEQAAQDLVDYADVLKSTPRTSG